MGIATLDALVFSRIYADHIISRGFSLDSSNNR